MAFSHSALVTAEIDFTNEGWGKPDTIRLLARLSNQETLSEYIELPVRTIDNSHYRFDIAPLLAPHGISTNVLKQALETEGIWEGSPEERETSRQLWSKVQIPCARQLDRNKVVRPSRDKKLYEQTDETLSRFPTDCAVQVEGYLEYTWLNSQAEMQEAQHKFETDVYVTPPTGIGAPAFGPTGTYDVELKEEGTSYSISVPLSQPIEPGKFDRFVLWLGAPQSSQHEFIIHLKYNDGEEIIAKKVNFDYLLPRQNREILNAEQN